MARKLRILHAGEAPYLSTGYAVYANEVQKRLVASGRYEVAQLACYDDPTDRRRDAVGWKLYPNDPTREEVGRNPAAQWGGHRFNEACLDFRPDVVWDIRDPFMVDFAERSPFRPFFRWLLMPTVDAVPQHEQWLATYAGADGCFAYSDWGADVLRREGGGLIDVLGSAPPGADLETFRPMDRAECRRSLGFLLDDDAIVVGTVMRNQPRKLYPSLIADFAAFLEAAPAQLASRAHLYLHTSYPDDGFDIPRLIKRSGISRKILVTYLCRNCKAAMARLYSDAAAYCPSCQQFASAMPNVKDGVESTVLAAILNSFDAYVQYATNEGFGMPQVEAASCGLPVFATDYSAMSDVVRKVGGYPIRCTLQMEAASGRYLATPVRSDFVASLIRHFELPEALRIKKGLEARAAVERHYDWGRTAALWMGAFDRITPMDEAATWGSPSRARPAAEMPGRFPTNEDLVRWAITEYLGRPDLSSSYMAMRMIRDLNWGIRGVGLGQTYQNEECMIGQRQNVAPFGAPDMMREMGRMLDEFNRWEARRCPQES